MSRFSLLMNRVHIMHSSDATLGRCRLALARALRGPTARFGLGLLVTVYLVVLSIDMFNPLISELSEWRTILLYVDQVLLVGLLLEILLQVFALGTVYFVRHWINVADCAVVAHADGAGRW